MSRTRQPPFRAKIAFLALLTGASASAFPARAEEPEEVVLCHAGPPSFRHAGAYVALAEGLFEAQGLAVRIESDWAPEAIVAAVGAGEIDFGIAGSEALLARLRGAPIVSVAVVMQQTPRTLVVLRQAGAAGIADLADFEIVLAPNVTSDEFVLMLERGGVPREKIRLVAGEIGVDGLIHGGKVAAATDALDPLTTELRDRDLLHRFYRPNDVRLTFYGDTLIAGEDRVAEDYALVAAFRRAMLEGWKRVFAQPEAASERLLSEFGAAQRGFDARHFGINASMMRGSFVMPRRIEIGAQNVDRWREMADEFGKLHGDLDSSRLAGFVFDPTGSTLAIPTWLTRLSLVASLAVLATLAWVWQLRRLVRRRTRDLEAKARDLRLEREAAESVLRVLRRNTELLARLFDQAGDAILVSDREGAIVEVNRAAEDLLGRPRAELLGRPAIGFVAADERVAAAVDERRVAKGERLVIRRRLARGEHGDTVEAEISTRQLSDGRTLAIARDLSERSRMEEQLRQAQKMESIGRFAGGIAHDFNNILTAIIGCGELARERLPPGDPAASHVDSLLHAAGQAADLTRQLLAFARRQVTRPQILDPAQALRDASKMLKAILLERIELRLEIQHDVWPVLADPGQFTQIVLNLAVNARDAMPGGGTLRIALRNVVIDAARAAENPPATEGEYVQLEVEDHGHGMEQDVLAHLFEPFFTTKEPGQGTGLGLATCYGIVRQHGGFLEVESRVGVGSVFRVHLPRERGTGETTARWPGPRGDGRGERVLLVEDNELVRDSTTAMLESLGYRVRVAGDGAEALAVLREPAAGIDVVLSDLVMPNLGGLDLYRRIRETDPELGVVLTSGFSREDDHEVALLDPRLRFVPKPYGARDLAAALRAVIEIESSQGG
jgi:PAS domain S-box-containing protein